MVVDNHHIRWLRALAMLGPAFVRNRLDSAHTGRAPETEVREIVEEPPYPSRGFVESWYGQTLRRLERVKAARRSAVTVIVTLGAIAGILVITFW